jgi:uncharacterized membrane protein
VAALFTKKVGISGIERIALSFILSIAVVPLIGLILNYMPWGISLESILSSVVIFIFITSVIAWLRRRRLAEARRFDVELYLKLPSRARSLRLLGWGKSVWDKVLVITLLIAILGSLGTLVFLTAVPKGGETFTEFYILGPEGKAADYPEELKIGEEASVTVGIINHEGKEVSYRVEVVIGDDKVSEVGPVTLADEQKWEDEVGFTPEVAGQNQEVQFLLYKDGEAEPCLEPLRLWVDVTE